MTTKLYAVVDKNGNHASKALKSEYLAWLDCLSVSACLADDSYVKEQVLNAKQLGYRCIELHTYDPATHGVYEKENQIAVWIGHLQCLQNDLNAIQESNADAQSWIKQYLSAGKE